MTVYSVCPSKKYGFLSTNNVDEMQMLIKKIKCCSLDKNCRIIGLEKKEKLGNICPVEVSCISVAIDFRAKQVLDLCNTCISIENIDGYEFVIPEVIDVLDTKKSDISYFKGSANIKWIDRYCFDTGKLTNTDLFVIPNCITPVMCTDKFYNCVKQNRLTGISFKKIFEEQ